jgi:selenoprotein W-related protein
MPRALRVRDEIKRAYPDSLISMVPKPGGYFDVVVDGKTIFSKTEKIGTPIERFPEMGEVVELIEHNA